MPIKHLKSGGTVIDGDITTTDHETFYQNGKCVLIRKLETDPRWWDCRNSTMHWCSLGQFPDYKAAVRAYMERTQFWPNVWFVSDHGNAHLMDLTEGKGIEDGKRLVNGQEVQ